MGELSCSFPADYSQLVSILSTLLRAFADRGAHESEGMSGERIYVNQQWGLRSRPKFERVWSNILSGAEQEQQSE